MTKRQQDHKEVRGEILTKIKPRAGKRDAEFKFMLTRHTKFKKCMSECNKAAKAIKM